LRERDFALLWAGMVVSLLGDGIYFVAIAWQVYDLTSSPGALSLVGLAWSLGMVGFLLLGGVAADRVERRRLMLTADAVRLVCVAAMGVLALTGAVEVWHLAALSLVYGTAEAFFSPAFSSTIPLLVPPGRLVQANALQEVVRPMAFRLAGPALGGVLVATIGAGGAFLVDAATFTVALACVGAIRTRTRIEGLGPDARPGGVREGIAWGRRRPWFWASLVAAALSLLCTVGPIEVLLPYVVRNDLGAGAGAFGLVLAAGGVGGVAGGLLMGRRGLPARRLRVLFALWTTCTLAVAGYALTSAVWQLMVLTFAYGLCVSCGMVIWATLMQTRVPPELLGRVTSVDWLVSIGLSPLSFALVGPIAALVGTDATLVGAGLLGSAATAAIFLLVPALRADDARSARGPHGGPPRDAAPAGTADARGEPAQV
jgi:DHA3 family tetracycline resistance protein-like MFS transporter